ncbi:MAG: hypothetical protein HYV75_09035 [Opitutae bacterium]|nr:hypothetical protein [Opitutae bacterium]
MMRRSRLSATPDPGIMLAGLLVLFGCSAADCAEVGLPQARPAPIHLFRLPQAETAAAYDEAMAVSTLQGLINRDAPTLYVLPVKASDGSDFPIRSRYWLNLFSGNDGWLAGRPQVTEPDLDALVRLAGARLKGAVIWDPAVPATANIATTIAGVRDAVVLSPELADRRLAAWRIPVLEDLRGRFTGAETGSAKNDAYRWAIREYLAPGRCSDSLLCLHHDAYDQRKSGRSDYVVTRDWAVKRRAFVFDLSPWGDELPADDPGQRLGLDLVTYRMILEQTLRHSAGRRMTELAGFFSFEKYSNFGGHKSAHEPVPTEWETVHLITPYNVYQNTSTSNAFNQSFHSHAPRRPLKQAHTVRPVKFQNKKYLCFLMADYDSAYVLYDYLPKFWDDPNRGKLPVAWGINPNLLETYPDLIAHFYRTLTPADTITADAGAAGYVNPNMLRPEHLPLFVRHNQAFFREADLTIAPMVIDWSEPSPAVKDAFRQFAPDGFGAMVWDMRTNSGEPVKPHVWKGMPVLQLRNEANEFPGAEATADIIANTLAADGKEPGFYFFRIVWTGPTQMLDMLAILRRKHPELDFEVLDPNSFFALARERLPHRTDPAHP